ncbi:hypothetical protein Taro_049869 [Colocasia esculenta]|uniref:Uncharacterized protein n=1 Tax=Colocasia esculenta TaxID=4460 RepID=A0A843XC61_COLES|nr:hypothetical protein [Colocasia esculenta]
MWDVGLSYWERPTCWERLTSKAADLLRVHAISSDEGDIPLLSINQPSLCNSPSRPSMSPEGWKKELSVEKWEGEEAPERWEREGAPEMWEGEGSTERWDREGPTV